MEIAKREFGQHNMTQPMLDAVREYVTKFRGDDSERLPPLSRGSATVGKKHSKINLSQ